MRPSPYYPSRVEEVESPGPAHEGRGKDPVCPGERHDSTRALVTTGQTRGGGLDLRVRGEGGLRDEGAEGRRRRGLRGVGPGRPETKTFPDSIVENRKKKTPRHKFFT